MAEKRAKKAAEEAKEAKANEQIRRKSGKVLAFRLRLLTEALNFFLGGFSKDIGKLRDELKTKESLKEMEKKKQGIRHMSRLNSLRLTEPGHREAR